MKKIFIIPVVTIFLLSSCNDKINQEAKQIGIEIYNAMNTTLNKSDTLGLKTKINSCKLDLVEREKSSASQYDYNYAVKVNDLKIDINTLYSKLFNMVEYEGNEKYKSINTYENALIDASYNYENSGKNKQSFSFDAKGSFDLLKDYLIHNVTVKPKEGDAYTAYGDYLNFEKGGYASLLRNISDSIKFSGFGKWDIKETLNQMADGIEGEYRLSKVYFNDNSKFSIMFDPFRYLINKMSELYIETKDYINNNEKDIKEYLRLGFTAMMGAFPDSIKVETKDNNKTYSFKFNYNDINEIISNFDSLKDYKVLSGTLKLIITVDSESKIIYRNIIGESIKTDTLKYTYGGVDYETTINEISLNIEDSSDYSITESEIDNKINDAMKLNWMDVPFNLDEE